MRLVSARGAEDHRGGAGAAVCHSDPAPAPAVLLPWAGLPLLGLTMWSPNMTLARH